MSGKNSPARRGKNGRAIHMENDPAIHRVHIKENLSVVHKKRNTPVIYGHCRELFRSRMISLLMLKNNIKKPKRHSQ
uniref:Uncharacterized protein n=1 Tax=viral metagenome TaxID=1070528 RepID=A0A6C0CBG1_9ZZZZ